MSGRGQRVVVGSAIAIALGSLGWSLANRYSVRGRDTDYLPRTRAFLQAALALDSNRLVQLGAGSPGIQKILRAARERPVFLETLAGDLRSDGRSRNGDRSALYVTAPGLNRCDGWPLIVFISGTADSVRIEDVALGCPKYPAPDSVFRAGLLDRVARDQAIRDTLTTALRATGAPPVPVIQRMNRVDSANLAWLKPRLDQRGWPSVELVGSDGVEAAFLLVQHSDADPDFQERMLPLLEAAYRRGAVQGQDLALLTDRVAKARGRPQRYGTQTTIREGLVVIDPIGDSANVDRRRAELGLPSLVIYKHKLDSIFTPAGRPRP